MRDSNLLSTVIATQDQIERVRFCDHGLRVSVPRGALLRLRGTVIQCILLVRFSNMIYCNKNLQCNKGTYS